MLIWKNRKLVKGDEWYSLRPILIFGHFFHRKILEYCPNRQFTCLEEMHEHLIQSWNDKVKPNDLVFHLGDFAFQAFEKMEEIKGIVKRLYGSIITLKGNHDKTKFLSDFGFPYVYSESYIKVDNVYLHLNHFPLSGVDKQGTPRRPKDRMPVRLNLHGHSHSTPDKAKTFDDWGKLIALDIGVDSRTDHAPWSWEEIHELFDYGYQG